MTRDDGGSNNDRKRDRAQTDSRGPGRQFYVPAPDASSARAAVRGGGAAGPSTAQPSPARGGTRVRTTPPAPPARERPPQQPKPARRSRGRRRARWLLLIPVALLLLIGFLVIKGLSTYNRIERLDLDGALAPVSGGATNYLLVGSDSRAEFDPEGSSGVTGSRADTIIVLRIDESGSKMMSVPRDLWVKLADTGQNGRINGSYNRGAANLVRTLSTNLDVPINHYIEVGFGSFAGLVDALGGVPIDFPNPAFDEQSGLNITEPGVHMLNGEQALAYARSRHFVEIVDGKKVKDPTADLGRQQRQQAFLRAALGELGKSKNPVELLSAADAMSRGLKVDQGLGLRDMFTLARKLGAADPETVILPTLNARKGKAAVLVLKEPDAQGVLAGFR